MTTYYNAEFAAEFIVKRDPEGNWCEPTTDGGYASLITGLNGSVICMAEGPDGKIYVGGYFTDAGGIAGADYLARWNPTTEAWEAVGDPNNGATVTVIRTIAFDAAGDLYVGGRFNNLAGIANADSIAKYTLSTGAPAAWEAVYGGGGVFGGGSPYTEIYVIAISPSGTVYAGGEFTQASSNLNCKYIAYWNGTVWAPLATGLSAVVIDLAFAPNGNLYIGGNFANADGTYGDKICYWDGAAFHRLGTVEVGTGIINTLEFDNAGNLYVGGEPDNIGGITNADNIAMWNGTQWKSLSSGTNSTVSRITINSGKVYVSGGFTSAGGLTLTDRVAVWSNGAWQPLDIDLPGTAFVYSILPASDGSLYIGGAFSTAAAGENAVSGISYEIEVAEEIEEDFDTDDLDPVDGTGV